MLPPGHALSVYRVVDEVRKVPEDTPERLRESAFQDLAAARDQLHRAANDVGSTRRKNERGRINAQAKRR